MESRRIAVLAFALALGACETNSRGDLDWTYRAKQKRAEWQAERISASREQSAERREWESRSKTEKEKEIAELLEDCRLRVAALRHLEPFSHPHIDPETHETYLEEAMEATGFERRERLRFQQNQLSRDIYRELTEQGELEITRNDVSSMSGADLLLYVKRLTAIGS